MFRRDALIPWFQQNANGHAYAEKNQSRSSLGEVEQQPGIEYTSHPGGIFRSSLQLENGVAHFGFLSIQYMYIGSDVFSHPETVHIFFVFSVLYWLQLIQMKMLRSSTIILVLIVRKTRFLSPDIMPDLSLTYTRLFLLSRTSCWISKANFLLCPPRANPALIRACQPM